MLAITKAMKLNTRGQCGPLVHSQGSSTRTRKTSRFYSYLISTLKGSVHTKTKTSSQPPFSPFSGMNLILLAISGLKQ